MVLKVLKTKCIFNLILLFILFNSKYINSFDPFEICYFFAYIFNFQYGSLILETDNDLVELETPIFITSESTVAAGELADGGISVQV